MQRAENWDALAVGEKVPERVGESASGSKRDPGASCTGASKDSAGEHGTGTGQELREAAARVQCAQYESRESEGTEPGTAKSSAAVAGENRVAE